MHHDVIISNVLQYRTINSWSDTVKAYQQKERGEDFQSLLTMRQQLAEDSTVWQEATELLLRQEANKSTLKQLLQSKLLSGLYTNEKQGPDENSQFTNFVRYVRSSLSRSPRTVLRQALNVAFRRIQAQPNQVDDFKTLFELLEISDKSNARMHQLAHVVQSLSSGKCHRRLLHCQKAMNTPSKYETDPLAFRQQVTKGIQTKHLDHDSSFEASSDLVDTIVQTVIQKDEQRREDLSTEMEKLKQQLLTDPEYNRFCQVQDLWESSRCRTLWHRYLEIDKAICQSRGVRGSDFETNASQLCFAAIVLQLLGTAPGSIHSADQFLFSNVSEYSYETNVYWWKKKKIQQGSVTKTGEIDLAIYWRGQVVAICELKSSCFEIAIACRQHHGKIEETTGGDMMMYIGKDANDLTAACLEPISSMLSPTPPMRCFIATQLPKDANSMLGVEPVLANAICHGLREQNCLIASKETETRFCEPLVQLLLIDEEEDCWSGSVCTRVESAVKYLLSIPSANDSVMCQEEEDYDAEKLCLFVHNVLGKEELQLSPLGCLETYHESILVLETLDSALFDKT